MSDQRAWTDARIGEASNDDLLHVMAFEEQEDGLRAFFEYRRRWRLWAGIRKCGSAYFEVDGEPGLRDCE